MIVLSCSWVRAQVDVRGARGDIAAQRYEEAESKLVVVAKDGTAAEKQEALYLLAGLKKTVAEAEIIYQEVIRLDPKSRWARGSQLELAKIQYAVGNYNQAYDILDASNACDDSEEACFFQGLSALMLKQYPNAKESLDKVRRGPFQPWAFLSLAEIDMNIEGAESACKRYRRMARSYISPTAMYRYGECLEKEGNAKEAAAMFGDLITSFGGTPEAVLAAEKVERLSRAPAQDADQAPRGDTEAMPAEDFRRGFTLQFGAFHDRTNAIKLAARIKEQLPGVRIDSDVVDNKEVHRVRYGFFRNRQDAQKRADELQRRIREPITIMTLP